MKSLQSVLLELNLHREENNTAYIKDCYVILVVVVSVQHPDLDGKLELAGSATNSLL